jgi:hypothetical protein
VREKQAVKRVEAWSRNNNSWTDRADTLGTRKPPEHNLVLSPTQLRLRYGSQGWWMRFGKGDETQW